MRVLELPACSAGQKTTASANTVPTLRPQMSLQNNGGVVLACGATA